MEVMNLSLLAILFVILILWRVCTILRIVATPDFFLGLVLNVPLLLYFDHCTESYSYGYYGKLVTTPAIFLGLLCLIFMLFKNKLIPRPLRRPISFAVSKGWTVTSCICPDTLHVRMHYFHPWIQPVRSAYLFAARHPHDDCQQLRAGSLGGFHQYPSSWTGCVPR